MTTSDFRFRKEMQAVTGKCVNPDCPYMKTHPNAWNGIVIPIYVRRGHSKRRWISIGTVCPYCGDIRLATDAFDRMQGNFKPRRIIKATEQELADAVNRIVAGLT